VCVQAAGNERSPGDPPSNSRYVLAVGGTIFRASPDDATRSEAPWPPSGFGDTDIPVPRPAWQRAAGRCSHAGGVFSCAKRAVPDVSATAANVPVFRPTRNGFDWSYFHGTSLSTPLWAALIALADQALQSGGQRPIGIDELHQVLYRGYVAGGLDDISPDGWDWETGLGSPRAGIVGALAAAVERYRLQR
jgi:kumamolisin